ncbi:MAG: type II CAAX endopeptidase family protein [Polyangiaceae bacterium]
MSTGAIWGALGGLFAAAGPRVATEPPSIWQTAATALGPYLGYVLIAPILWVFFGRTWRELDVEAHEHQRKTLASGGWDRRPAVLFAITAAVLTLQEYYGGRQFYDVYIKSWIRLQEALHQIDPQNEWVGGYLSLKKYNDLYGYGWWAFTRVFGYVVVPFATWKLFFRKDSILDMGLRTRGLLKHAWIYLLCLAVVLPATYIVSRSPDFGNYYPFYKLSSRSWTDFLIWEAMYFAQFFGLEIFFRGFWLSALRRSLGSGAIFAMVVPYCMIHYGKPYLETCGAVVAGVALGSVAMRTRSIYSGFLVHVTVALSMDVLALSGRGALPTVW